MILAPRRKPWGAGHRGRLHYVSAPPFFCSEDGPMLSRWSDADAHQVVEGYGKKGVSEDVALRTYSTRLLGGDPLLVLHGGGNTSVKTRLKDLLGETHDVLCVKGSGWDMGSIEPAGLPAVKLEPLRG